MKISTGALFIFLLSLQTFAQPRIDLSEGTLFINGSLAFGYDMIGFEKPEHRFDLKSDLGGGYFVIDNLAVGLSVPVQWAFMPSNGRELGLKISTTYYFDTDSVVFPYLGVNGTPRYSMSNKNFQLLGGLDAGVLVSLSESVALDFGLRPEIFFKLYDSQKWKISIPAGFFGVRAVF